MKMMNVLLHSNADNSNNLSKQSAYNKEIT